MERLKELFISHYGAQPDSVIPLTGSASPRCYYLLKCKSNSCVGVIGTDREENDAFVSLAEHLLSKGINVPEVYAVSEDGMAYIQEYLGEDNLFDLLTKARREGDATQMQNVESLLYKTISCLPEIQFSGARDLDFSLCHPQEEFSRRSVMFDLNYFKYCFLKLASLEFHEMLLQDDFERLADDLMDCGLPVKGANEVDVPTFLYRDFQARNVMIRDGQPYFIDFQSGRRGPIYYDVASFIWHARAEYPSSLQDKMMDVYLSSLSKYIEVDPDVFKSNLRIFLLFRYLQVLGAYGFRGWMEKKANFVVSIPSAVRSLAELLEKPFERYPYLTSVLNEMVRIPRFKTSPQYGGLEVKVCSFSFKKGVPEDPTGNGGGYVFDCRSIHNPGRYEQYKKLTGRDEEVIRFLEEDGEVTVYLSHLYKVVDAHVATYVRRGFSSLMLSFGCTGGQHRSVYCAEKMAQHLREAFPEVKVTLTHREQQ